MPKGGTIRVFDFKEVVGPGVVVVPIKGPELSSDCVIEQEVDAQISLLKADLDALAKRMKAALRNKKGKPLFGPDDM